MFHQPKAAATTAPETKGAKKGKWRKTSKDAEEGGKKGKGERKGRNVRIMKEKERMPVVIQIGVVPSGIPNWVIQTGGKAVGKTQL